MIYTVDHEDDGRFYHQVVLELVDVEELPPVFADENVRLEMSSRFKSEGNEKFTAGDYVRSDRGTMGVFVGGQRSGSWCTAENRERSALPDSFLRC